MATSANVLGSVVMLCVMMTFASRGPPRALRVQTLSKEDPWDKIASYAGHNQLSVGGKLRTAIHAVELEGRGERQ